jgi:fructokinase
MNYSIGLDIGGTKIAGAIFDEAMNVCGEMLLPTPDSYDAFLKVCRDVVVGLEQKVNAKATIGIGVPGIIDRAKGSVCAVNIACLNEQNFHSDVQKILDRTVNLANDANCAALSEAKDGAGAGYGVVFGIILGTGVGGGLVVDGKIVAGRNGLAGEWGHIPLPYREAADGPMAACACGQIGCIEKTICGAALGRLYEMHTGERIDARDVVKRAGQGEGTATAVLDHFYTVIAKCFVAIIHAYDPDVIVVGGGMNDLPELYDKVPQRWNKFILGKKADVAFVRAKHGATSGIRGAAWAGRG